MAGWHISCISKTRNLFKVNIGTNCVQVKKKFINESTNAETKNNNHVYKSRLTKMDAINYLLNNVSYKTDNFIVTSKPYGMGKEKQSRILEKYIPQTFEEIYLADILRDVSSELGYTSLHIVKSPERLASGVMILAVNEVGKNETIKSLKISKTNAKLCDSYIVITQGCPTKKFFDTKFGIQTNNDKKSINEVNLVSHWSQNSVKRREVKVVRWRHEVISKSNIASLIRVNISSNHKNCLKLCLATKFLSPVLGDQLFSRRVGTIFGVPLLVNDHSKSNNNETSSSDLLAALKLQRHESKIIPCHVHLHSVSLQFKNNEQKTFTAPPPETFLWTCKQLNLSLNNLICSDTE